LEVIAYPINDVVGNCTRFLLLRRQAEANPQGPHASLAFSLQANRPGALLEALGCFAKEGLNMSRIESRPSKRSMGEYIFFVDLDLKEGSVPLDRAMAALGPLCERLILFGVYPLNVVDGAGQDNTDTL
jgi:prephenate dehydratase